MQCEQKFWVVTASADHAENGKSWGIVQACHGKAAPLRRMKLGDGVAIYSPKTQMAGGESLMAFTAIGRISDAEAYTFDMGGGFQPWRRAVHWQLAATPLPIKPILDQLDLTRGLQNWGMVFRYGLTGLTRADFALLARKMILPGEAIPFVAATSHIKTEV